MTHIANHDGKALCNGARTIQTNHDRGLATCDSCCRLDFDFSEGDLPWLEDDHPSMGSFADIIEARMRTAQSRQANLKRLQQMIRAFGESYK